MYAINKKNLSLIIILFLFLSCSFYSDEDLGSNYWFWEDGNQSQIVHSNNMPISGYTIIDANVSRYNFNDRYIIAKSNWLIKNGQDTYWIIDKSIKINNDTTLSPKLYEKELKRGLKAPMDSITFYKYLKKNKIDLRFED